MLQRHQARADPPQNVLSFQEAAVARRSRRRRWRGGLDSRASAADDRTQDDRDDRGALASAARSLLLVCGLAGAVGLGVVIGLLLP